MKLKYLLSGLIIPFMINPAFATDKDYSQAAGHTGAYVNVNNVWSLKCRIITYDSTAQNNKLGWYTAWPMIVDYKTGKFVQIGYITSPKEGINKPTFYVAWSSDGKQINIKYLPNKEAAGNALVNGNNHEYALSLNSDGSANIQIDGKKYLEELSERIQVGITQGTGEFFSEGSNLEVDISTKFSECAYKVRGGTEWLPFESNKKVLLYHVAQGTSIEKTDENAFIIKGRLKKVNKGKFFNTIKSIVIKDPSKS